MKAVIILIVLLGLVIAGVWYFGGYRTLDPDQQGNMAKAAIKPGMTWQQVLTAAGENPRYVTIALIKEKGGIEVERESPEMEFDRAKLTKRLKSSQPAGFKFIYRFSQKVAFEVKFDSSGKVEDVQDVRTIADLLQTR